MSAALTLTKRKDGVAVLLFDAPDRPVNVLCRSVMAELAGLLGEIAKDSEIRAVVLASGKPEGFIAGADLDEVLAMDAAAAEGFSRDGHALLFEIARSPKPFVAAIHGAALGGGCEVALACHYRLATDATATVLGLPEVTLGLLPAAGGTQRLPRLAGLPRALPMLLTGKRLRARQALKAGIVDAVTSPGGLVETAAKAALALASGAIRPARFPKGLAGMLLTGPLKGLALGKARKEVLAKTRGLYPAPLAILDCVTQGLARGEEEGAATESRLFGPLVGSEGAKNLVRLFHATTDMRKRPQGAAPRRVARVGVLGAGLMGEGIAAVSLPRGTVVLRDVSDEMMARAIGSITRSLEKRQRSGALSRRDRDLQRFRLIPARRVADLAGCDLVIEAVFEDLGLKKLVLAEVEGVLRPDAVIASNTSALPIRDIAQGLARPARLVGMHYFSPVPKMPLLELVVPEGADEEAVSTAWAFGIAQGKSVVRVKDGPGFYTTRILAPYLNEAVRMLVEGAPAGAIDAALRDWGFPIGPLALLDEVGIDVGAHVSRDLGAAFPRHAAVPGFAKLKEAGLLGRKSGRGFYAYPKGGPKTPNAEVRELLGAAPERAVAARVVIERVGYLMVNEAVRCLDEGVVASPRDGDVAAVLGLGFPPFRGGPFRTVDALGAASLAKRLEALAAAHGPRYEPAEGLVARAATGERYHAGIAGGSSTC